MQPDLLEYCQKSLSPSLLCFPFVFTSVTNGFSVRWESWPLAVPHLTDPHSAWSQRKEQASLLCSQYLRRTLIDLPKSLGRWREVLCIWGGGEETPLIRWLTEAKKKSRAVGAIKRQSWSRWMTWQVTGKIGPALQWWPQLLCCLFLPPPSS